MFFSNIFKSNKPISFDAAVGFEGGTSISKPCETCRWWNPLKPAICESFPKGIPLVILLGYVDHTVPFGDEDLLYEPSMSLGIKKADNLSEGGGTFEELHPRYPKGTSKAGKFMPKGSPEYVAARKASLERFDPAKYAVGRSSIGAETSDYDKKSNSRKMREGYLLAKKTLTPEDFKEFNRISAELEQDRLDGRETYKQNSKPNPNNPRENIYTPERLQLHNKILSKLFENAENQKPTSGKKPEMIFLGGLGGCLSGDHEYLSPTGWKKISEYDGGKVLVTNPTTNASFYETPEAYIKAPCDTFYHFKSRGVDMVLSGEHIVPFTKKYNPTVIRTDTAESIYKQHNTLSTGWDGLLPCTYAPPSNSAGIPLTDLELRLMVAVCADGNFSKTTKTTHCRISLTKQRKKDRLEKLLKDLDITFTMKARKSNPKEVRYGFYAPERNKCLSSYWGATAKQLAIIGDEVIHWDGSVDKHGSYLYYSNNRLDIDFVSHIFSTMGRRSSWYVNNHDDNIKWEPSYRLTGNKSKVAGVRSGGEGTGIFKLDTPNSFKYCFTTSTGFFVTRLNDCITVTGNSGKSGFEEGAAKVFDKTTHLKLDSDAIKEELPEYDPQKAYLSHVEAGDILDKAKRRAKDMGLNLALDATMSSSVLPEIQDAKSRGYSIQTHYMHIPVKESVGRALLRWAKTKDGKPSLDKDGKIVRGRLVPPFVILGMINNLKNFGEARRHADVWSFSRNNVAKGSAPVKVISNT